MYSRSGWTNLYGYPVWPWPWIFKVKLGKKNYIWVITFRYYIGAWQNFISFIRGVTTHRYIDISYRVGQRYAYRIVGACINAHDILSSGRNHAIKCPLSQKIFQIQSTKCRITVMGWNLIFPMISYCVRDILQHISIDGRKWGLFAIMSEMLL